VSRSTSKGPFWVAVPASVLLIILLLGVPDSPVPTPASSQGTALRIQIDPETGDIIPLTDANLSKAELDQQMRARLNRSTDGLRQIQHPDGRVSMDLEGRFQSLSVATVDSNGQVKTGCVTSQREFDHFMSNSDLPDTQLGKQE